MIGKIGSMVLVAGRQRRACKSSASYES